MSFEIIWRCLLALPGLAFPGLAADALTQSGDQPTQQERRANPAPKTTPKPASTATPRPVAATPRPSASPTPAAAATGGGGEIASEQACPGQGDVAKTSSVLVCLTTEARRANSRAAVSGQSQLMAAASAKATDMLNCGYGHTACGRASNYWVQAKGYTGRCSGENIAMGQRTPREVFTAWMNSPGHRANILNTSYRHIGVAQTASSRGPLWVMHLGGC